MKPLFSIALAALLPLSLAPCSSAASDAFRFDPRTYEVLARQSAGHPNERARWNGLWSYSNGRYDRPARISSVRRAMATSHRSSC